MWPGSAVQTLDPAGALAEEVAAAMNAYIPAEPIAQPFSVAIKQIVIRCINGAADPLDREDRIQTALEANIITYADAYALRCGDDL